MHGLKARIGKTFDEFVQFGEAFFFKLVFRAVIRLKRRQHYMEALEQASVGGDIRPFSEFVAGEMAVDWTREKN